MANVSANTLFHYTRSFDNLKSIIKEGQFYPSFSPEPLKDYIGEDIAIPMVCFCDIPLSQVNNHTNDYGKYAIGFHKNWGMNLGIAPVLYVHKNALTQHILNELSAEIHRLDTTELNKEGFDLPEEEATPVDIIKEPLFYNAKRVKNPLEQFIRYLKPYEGSKWDKKKNDFISENLVRFYNEREWRYVGINYHIIPISKYKKTKIIPPWASEFDSNLKKHVEKLPFAPLDIKYIIVESDAEVGKMVDYIEKIYQDYTNKEEIKLLITRITSMQHIEGDF